MIIETITRNNKVIELNEVSFAQVHNFDNTIDYVLVGVTEQQSILTININKLDTVNNLVSDNKNNVYSFNNIVYFNSYNILSTMIYEQKIVSFRIIENIEELLS